MHQRSRIALMIVLALSGALISSVMGREQFKSSGGPKVECWLILDNKPREDLLDFNAVFELKNISEARLSIKYGSHKLFDYLELEVRDDNGKLLPNTVKRYDHIFSPGSRHTQINYIKPGAVCEEGVSLFVQVDKRKHPIVPGFYTIQAVYRWDHREYRSNKVTVQVLAE